MRSDRELVDAVLDGDASAYAELVARYERSARAVAFHCLRDHHAAEDAAQDAFVTAYQTLATLREPSLFGRWLLTIARNRAVRMTRMRPRHAPLEEAAEVASTTRSTGNADHDELLEAMMRLPEREQRLMMLRHFSGHSVADMARILDRPIGTITKQLSRGYARLRERLVEATP